MQKYLILLVMVSLGQATEKSAQYMCRSSIIRAEHHFKIPASLLAAVSLIESGKVVKGQKDVVAWPWALNVEGVPKFYPTKTEATLALQQYLDAGITNIDVGCMQLNYRHHGKAFKSPAYMLDPKRNVDYGAQFLLQLHKRYKSWTKAIGHYHSATLKHQVPYRKKVYDKWQAVRHQLSDQEVANEIFTGTSPQARRLMKPLPSTATPQVLKPQIVGHLTR
jgi:soluble lytic murein transglycosylase-like protein